MSLMILNTKAFAAPVETPEVDPIDVVSYATSKCALGHILAARSGKGVCAISMGDDRAYLEVGLAASFPKAVLIANFIAVQEDLSKALCYLERPADGLHLTLDMRGTPFQRRVWEKLRAISVGRTLTYLELAHLISPLASPRAVARACAANVIALAIPCHRVVANDGNLGGYCWGLERKRELLARERRSTDSWRFNSDNLR